VLDPHVHPGQGVPDPPPMVEIEVCPSVVVTVQLDGERLDGPDELDGGDVRTARLAAAGHADIRAVSDPARRLTSAAGGPWAVRANRGDVVTIDRSGRA
jgi:hypothetical protein